MRMCVLQTSLRRAVLASHWLSADVPPMFFSEVCQFLNSLWTLSLYLSISLLITLRLFHNNNNTCVSKQHAKRLRLCEKQQKNTFKSITISKLMKMKSFLSTLSISNLLFLLINEKSYHKIMQKKWIPFSTLSRSPFWLLTKWINSQRLNAAFPLHADWGANADGQKSSRKAYTLWTDVSFLREK